MIHDNEANVEKCLLARMRSLTPRRGSPGSVPPTPYADGLTGPPWLVYINYLRHPKVLDTRRARVAVQWSASWAVADGRT